MIIDAHIHLWNPLHGKDLRVDRKALSWGKAKQDGRIYYAAPPAFKDSQSTYQRALAHMDCLGIQKAVVLQEFMDGKQDDYLAQVRHLEPERFTCMALFDKHYYDDSMKAFKTAIEEKKLQGFLVKTPNPFPEIANSKLESLWKTCAERGLPVVLKNGAPEEIRRLIKLVPDLKIVLSHFAGNSGPKDDHIERLRFVADFPNLYIDTGGSTFQKRYPFSEVKEQLHAAVEMAGADKISWGSDYPRPGLVVDNSYKQQLDFIAIDCDFLADEQREMILGGTASRVYKWD
ncbi:amidohydrolase family protein [Candidatus Poribacteria bacterium]|nr:amidohydrolase family protein [Candidatus Poribacteria bacterium]